MFVLIMKHGDRVQYETSKPKYTWACVQAVNRFLDALRHVKFECSEGNIAETSLAFQDILYYMLYFK